MEHAILLLVAGVAVAGVAAQWLGWRFHVPSILALLVFGMIIGPVFQWVRPAAILGPVMSPAISMAVAIIVFEGGLNLNLRELRSAGSGVTRLVFLALPLNWVFGAAAGHYVGGLSWAVAVLFGAILVVTGPTVILPLLRQAKLEPRASAFLKWEAIVNDPIGATLTLLILSVLLMLRREGQDLGHLSALGGRALLGAVIAGALGFALPFALRYGFRRDLAPEYLKTPLLLAGALGVYAAGELSLAPLARALGLASGAPPGLLIVGASAWTTALARALRTLGVPTLIVDPSFEALRAARREGLATARVEILSAVGDHIVDLRDLDYLYAATDDDAYNALVCTRFAGELGRERVHQPPPAGEREVMQATREWRGKYAPHASLTHARLSELVADGYGFVIRKGAETPPGSANDERWPVLALSPSGALTFRTAEDEEPAEPSAADTVVWFERTRAPTPSRRRWWFARAGGASAATV